MSHPWGCRRVAELAHLLEHSSVPVLSQTWATGSHATWPSGPAKWECEKDTSRPWRPPWGPTCRRLLQFSWVRADESSLVLS